MTRAGRRTADAPNGDVPVGGVVVEGRVSAPTAFEDRDLRDRAWATVACEFRCASGERFRGRWRGPRLGPLLEDAGVAGDVTHVGVVAGEYAACVPVRLAVDAVLTLERDGDPLDPGVTPRFVHPDIDSARAVKGVERVETVRLGPGTDRSEHESLIRG